MNCSELSVCQYMVVKNKIKCLNVWSCLGQEYLVWFGTMYCYYISISLISPDTWREIPIYVHICTELMSIKNSNVPFRRRAWLCYFCPNLLIGEDSEISS